MPRLALLMLSAAAVVIVAGCGGGGGGSSPPPTPAALTLTGVAATGSALSGATVDARCRGGSTGSAVAAANGSYRIDLGSGSLPCVLRATSAGGGATVLYSLAHGSGTAHITPASHLIVASLAGTDPALYYASFNDAAADALTTARVQAAHAAVVSVLTQGGVDFSTFGNLLTASLVAASGGNAGNAFDQALDALTARLTARGLTLTNFTDAVVRASSANVTATSNTASLPPQSLLQPASPSCEALRSGPYRLVMPVQDAPVGQYSTEILQIDAVAGTVLNGAGDTGTFTSAGTPCLFTSENGQFAVSSAGVLVLRSEETPDSVRLGLAFPEQLHSLADLAGSYQSIGMERVENADTYQVESLIADVNTAGQMSNLSYCENVDPCITQPGVTLELTAHSGGGFTLANPGDAGDRLFAYRAGNGDLMLVDLAGNGSFGVWTPRRAAGTVSVGVRQLFWGLWTNLSLLSTAAVSTSDFTVTASDATGWTRVAASDGHSETITTNSPRNGWVSRPEGYAPIAGGGTVLVRGFNGLVLRGMGMSALHLPTLGGGAYFFSVTQP